jgi:hypothetical protein
VAQEETAGALGSGRSQGSSPARYFDGGVDGVVELAPLGELGLLVLPGVVGVPAPLEPGVVALRDGAVDVPLLALSLASPQPTSASTLSAENATMIRLSINTSPHAIYEFGACERRCRR